MSARTSRSHVQSVSGTSASSALAVGGVMLAATAIGALFRSLGSSGQAARNAAPKVRNAVDTLQSVAALRDECRLRQQQAAAKLAADKLPPLEAARLSALEGLSATPYLVQDSAALREAVAALENAPSLAELRRTEQSLTTTIEVGHHQLFVQALTMACTQASMKVGFNSVQTMPGLIENTVRVIATDLAGRALVTEIHVDPQQEPGIETEVVGVTDGSCNQILDAFDRALEEAGVRAAPPRRKYTGGVCELAAARDYVLRKVKRPAKPSVATPAQEAGDTTRRTRQLNTGRTQKQR
jgi:hypothetical protein